MKRFYGCHQQPFDPRDHFALFNGRSLASLPSRFSLADKMGMNLDQEALGACGSNTAAECVMSNQIQEGIVARGLSRLFVYYNTRWLMGTVTQDSGVDNRSMMKALATYGFCDESLWPYDISKFKLKPPQAAYAAALVNRGITYGAVVQSLQQMKAAIYSGDPFIFGFSVFPQIESQAAAETGFLTIPKLTDNAIGGHDVSLFGWDDDLVHDGHRGYFFFRNHWRNEDGSWWGQNGNGFIPYAYATNAKWAWDFWIINTIPGAMPVPPPPPPPTPPPVPPSPRRTVVVTGEKIEVTVDGIPQA